MSEEKPGSADWLRQQEKSNLASLRLNQAQDWNEFVAGMERHYTPSENMVYADVDGNIHFDRLPDVEKFVVALTRQEQS